MKILTRYLIKEFLLHLVFMLAVFLFVMLAAKVLKELMTLLISHNLGPGVLLTFMGLSMPYMLSFCLPLAVLTAAVLTFSKLSAENELLAAQASGVSLWRLSLPAIIAGGFLAVLAVYSNAELAPRGLAAMPRLVSEAILERLENDPTTLFEPGKDVRDFPGYILRVEGKDEQTGRLLDVRLFVVDRETGKHQADYRAEQAEILVQRQSKKLTVRLFNLKGTVLVPTLRPGLSAEEYEIDFDLDTLLKGFEQKMNVASMTLGQLFEQHDKASTAKDRSVISVEAHSRVVFAFACFVFAMVGVPLGIRTHRRETSIGILVSVLVAVAYYALILLAQTQKEHPQYYPVLILWSPNVLGEILGLWLLWRAARR